MNERKLCFDYNASTPVHADVLAAMNPYFSEIWGNPSSGHWQGREALAGIELARIRTAALIGALPTEVFFVHGGTGGNNLAIKGMADAASFSCRRIIISSVEHSSVYAAAMSLRDRGFEIIELPVDTHGRVTPDSLAAALTPQTALVSIMMANNEIGTVQPIRELARLANACRVPFHCDAIQAAGKIPLLVDELGVDLLTISGHKIYGPKGVGALYIRSGLKIAPQWHGGEQEHGLQPGTENVPAIIGLGKACELAREGLMANARHLLRLRERLEHKLAAELPAAMITGHGGERLPNTLNICIPGLPGEMLAARLDQQGIAVSTGSACASSSGHPSRTLQACGLSLMDALCSIRISLGLHNVEADIDVLIRALFEIVSCEQAMKSI